MDNFANVEEVFTWILRTLVVIIASIVTAAFIGMLIGVAWFVAEGFHAVGVQRFLLP